MVKIIVGVEATERSHDAVAFAGRLATQAHARLILASVFPSDAPSRREPGPAFDARLRERTMEAVRRQLASLDGVDADVWALSGASAARHLAALAEEQDAALIVVGPSHRAALGRVFAGTTAQRLLHIAPCPVAVVPAGFADRERGPVSRILVGYDGGAEATVALRASMAAARGLSASVRVVQVLGSVTESALAGGAFVSAPREADARLALEAAVGELRDGVAVETELVRGEDAADELAARSDAADLLVLGSRGHGQLATMLLGSVSWRLVRRATCPLIVIPRGVDAHLRELFAAPVGARTHSSGAAPSPV